MKNISSEKISIICSTLVILFMLYAGSRGQEVILPHTEQCQFFEPCVYEKFWPNCSWTNEWCTWDSLYTSVYCIGVPTSYSISYNISSSSNLDFSVSVFEGTDQSTTYDLMYNEIYVAFASWARKDITKRPQSIPQPINGASAYDLSANNKTLSTIYTSSRTNSNCAGLFITRENLSEQYPCFVSLFDISIQ